MRNEGVPEFDRQKLRLARLRKGLSLRDLAAQSGLDRGNLGKYERGDARPKPKSLLALATALGVEVDALLKDVAA